MIISFHCGAYVSCVCSVLLGNRTFRQHFKAHKFNVIPQTEFLPMASAAKFIIRTGELKPYSNIYLYSASGVEKFNRDFVI